MIPSATRRYLVIGLENQPTLLCALLRDLDSDDDRWDLRPDPERFTLREVVAHLADFEPIWRERIERTAAEERPFLPSVDEEQMAIDHDYAHSDPFESLHRLRAGREALAATLKGLPDDAWERAAEREHLGPMTILAQAAMVLGHDGYHARQVIDWLEAAR